MKKILEVLCEIIFTDHKTGVITNRIGRIDKSQLSGFSSNTNDFIIFKETYNSPILKENIKEIIILRDIRQKSVNKVNSKLIKHAKSKNIGKIS